MSPEVEARDFVVMLVAVGVVVRRNLCNNHGRSSLGRKEHSGLEGARAKLKLSFPPSHQDQSTSEISRDIVHGRVCAQVCA